MKKIFLLLFVLIVTDAFSQNKKIDVYNLNFTELSKLKIVTASKTEQEIGEIPATIRVITANEISERGYFTLDEMLSDLPGFQFRNIMSLNSYIFQRGISNQNNLTLVLIDGVEINELNSGGFYGGGQYDLSNIERVEVVYGPSSVAYGTNAVSGVINIITKKPTANKGEIGVLAGSFKTSGSNASVEYADKQKRFGIRVTGMYKNSEKANLKGANNDYNWTDLLDNYENDYSAGLRLDIKDFSFGTDLLQKVTSTATTEKSTGTNYRDYGSSWNIRFVNNYLKYEKKFSDKLSFSSMLYNRNTTVLKNTVYYVLDTAQVGYFRPNNLTGLETVLTYNSHKSYSVTGGVDVEYEQLANGPTMTYSSSPDLKPPVPEKPDMKKDFLVSVFLEPQVTLFKKILLSGGVRFDQSTVYNQVFTPRVGLVYRFGSNFARLSYAEAFRAPRPWDYTDGLGNTDLLPEKINSTEASVTFVILKSFNINLVAYQNHLFNGFTKEISTDGYRWINSSAEIFTTGLEVNLQYDADKFHSFFNYTYNRSIDELTKEQLPEISTHCANAGITYLINSKLKINVRGNYIGKRNNPELIEATDSKIVGPYLIFNGAVTWELYPNMSMQLIGKNLLDAEYYHTSNRSPDRYRQPQRTLILELTLKI